MLCQSQFAVLPACALGQLRRFFLTNVVTFTLSLVAVLAEMRGAPAEPLCQIAAEATLELDEVRAVGLARFDAALDAHRRARRTHKLLRLVDLLLLLRTNTVFLATEIGEFALKALIVSQLEHCVGSRIIEVDRVSILQLLIFVHAFEFDS